MAKIIFYEDRNFQGRHYECSNDCADLSPYFSRCNSMRVMSDWWVMYERPNYMGYQYVLSRGEYPDYQRWMGFNDNIGSCRTYPYIIFYEDRNFQGRHYECSSDCADLSSYFSRCNSMRVMSDWWVMYERPNYMGYQYVLSRGEYPDYQRWMGFNDSISSCRTYPYYRGGNYRMRIYERPDFGGQMMEFMDDCPSVYDRFRYRDIYSCHVMDGYWIFYEHPNYRGRQYFMRPGEYRRYSDWGGYNSTIGSFRRMRDF
ncbi:hypothetical protein scyTo_0006060 [Scyliorhinus torazame]|uniref:Beta/gamma crystallin 'Greek key' domain-containing protein n=1 Tax=Scyliorhinus torazame TaxID=75743 RepID=A0A401PF87_SCYTO|nr:hypothetical protein [Scyliorhinus torazame]